GEIVGYVAVGRATRLESNRDVADIRGLAVAPNHQGRGLGRALVEAALNAARGRGARKVTLRVLGPNTAARALYESCGFVVEGVRRDEFLLDGRYVDDVLMARHLSGWNARTIRGCAPGRGRASRSAPTIRAGRDDDEPAL